MNIKFKNFILLTLALSALTTHSYALNIRDFFDFYTVFSPAYDKVILMPSQLRVKLEVGADDVIELITRPENLDVTWVSENPSVCRVTPNNNRGATLTALSPGECRIKISHPESGAEVFVNLTVSRPITHISLDRQTLNLSRGESATIRALTTPPDEDADILWEIIPKNQSAAISFGEDLCRVKALSAGEFDISATLENGQSSTAHITISGGGSTVGYTLCITLLFCGAIGLILTAWILKRRISR